MALYELEYDEGIILQSTTAMLGGASEEEFENEELMELVVTNKRIIYVVEISTGVFSKEKTEVRQVPISSIKVINGVSHAVSSIVGFSWISSFDRVSSETCFIDADTVCVAVSAAFFNVEAIPTTAPKADIFFSSS